MSMMSRLRERLRAMWVLQPGRRVAERDPDVSRIIFRAQGAAGVNIDADTAMKTAVVWACVTYLSRTVAQLPWRVMVERGDGRAERVSGSQIDYLINQRPNPEMGSFAFRETMVGWACRRGNAVAEIQRDLRGVPVALWPIHPTRGCFERDMESGEIVYKLHDGSNAVLRPYDYFHLRGFGEGPIGLDVVAYAAESIGWAQATEVFGATFFGSGINPSIAVTVPNKLTKEGKDVLREELDDLFKGPTKANRAAILDADMKLEKLTVDPNAAQFLETRQHQVEEICRWFGVPPHKVMHLLRSTFSNIEHQAIEVVTDSIVPWCKRLEEEADYKLFSPRSPMFTRLDLKGLLRGDFKTRSEGLQIMRRNGVINANDWLRLEDMNEIGEEGDIYIVESNMTRLDQVGMPAPAAPGARQSPAPADPVDPVDPNDPGDVPDPNNDPAARARREVRAAITELREAIEDRTSAPPQVTVHPPQVTVHPTHVNVEPPQVTVTVQPAAAAPAAPAAAPVIHVDSPAAPVVNVAAPIVNVEPARVEVPAPIVTVEAPVINVEAARVDVPATVVNVEAAPVPVVNVAAPVVNVEPAKVEIPAPVVNLQAPVVNFTAPAIELPAPVVNVEAPVITVENAAPEIPAPIVNVEAPVVHVAPAEVRVEPAVVNVDVKARKRGPVKRTFKRDASGEMTEMIERELEPGEE